MKLLSKLKKVKVLKTENSQIYDEIVNYFDLKDLSIIPALSDIIKQQNTFSCDGVISLLHNDMHYKLRRGNFVLPDENVYFVSRIEKEVEENTDATFEGFEIKTRDQLFDGKIWGVWNPIKQMFVKDVFNGKTLYAHIKFDDVRTIHYFSEDGKLVAKCYSKLSEKNKNICENFYIIKDASILNKSGCEKNYLMCRTTSTCEEINPLAQLNNCQQYVFVDKEHEQTIN